MLIRIVKMSFHPEKVPIFLAMFEQVKHKIRANDGCNHLELLQDKNNPSIFFTYSHWEDDSFLQKYRNSALFKSVWEDTKCHFNAKPEAWSVEQKVVVEG